MAGGTLIDGLIVVKFVWLAAAGVTALRAGRTWRHLRRTARSQLARKAPTAVQEWAYATSAVAGCLTAIAVLNGLAGLVSLAIPPRPDAPAPPYDAVDVAVFVVPIFFIMAALVTLYAAWRLDAGYRRVVAAVDARFRATLEGK